MAADFHYVVEGRWPFPLDMLRRDRSRAASTADQMLIDLLSCEVAGHGDTSEERRKFRSEVVQVNLVIPNAGRNERPLTARWESFGWSVPGDEHRALQKREEGRLARLKELHRSAMSKLSVDEREAVRWAAASEIL